MKILMLSDHAAPIGGSEISLMALRDGLRERGHEVRLLASSAGDDDGAADDFCFGTTSRWRTLLQSGNPWAAHKVRRVLADFQPDLVHVQIFLTQLSPLILALLRETPSVYYAVWYRAVCPLGTKMLPDGSACSYPAGKACYRQGCLPLRDWLPLMGQKALLERWIDVFNLVIANGTAVQQALQTGGIGPVEVISHSVKEWPHSAEERAAYPLIVYAGRLVPEKGVDTLIAAFSRTLKQFPEACLVIAGEGVERDRLLSQIEHLGIADQVSLVGHLSQEELHRRFEPAWVQVVPSRWAEPFGRVAAEAMIRGTPVIASNTGGLAEIVQDGETGLLVAPGDVDSLTAALLKLIENRELSAELGIRGRQIAAVRYGDDVFVESMIAAYQSVLGGPG
jgi:glycosyltransferase involved in cell wall biosynthesis